MSEIIMVDDEVKAIDSAKTLLERSLPSNIVGFTDPYDGLRILEQKPFDAIIIDLCMPSYSIDGIKVIKIISDLYPSLAKIILTGYSDVEPFKNQLSEVNYDLLLSKPLPMKTSPNHGKVIEKFRRVINKKNSSASPKRKIFKYSAKIRDAIVAIGDDKDILVENIISLHLQNEDIHIVDNFEKEIISFRRPLRFF